MRDHFRTGHPDEVVNTEVDVPREDSLVGSVGMMSEATIEDLSD